MSNVKDPFEGWTLTALEESVRAGRVADARRRQFLDRLDHERGLSISDADRQIVRIRQDYNLRLNGLGPLASTGRARVRHAAEVV